MSGNSVTGVANREPECAESSWVVSELQVYIGKQNPVAAKSAGKAEILCRRTTR